MYKNIPEEVGSDFVKLKKGDALNLPVEENSIDIAAQNCLFNIFKMEELKKLLVKEWLEDNKGFGDKDKGNKDRELFDMVKGLVGALNYTYAWSRIQRQRQENFYMSLAHCLQIT